MQNYLPISNNLKKFIVSLKQKEVREESNLFIAEGEKLCMELFHSKYKTELIVLSSKANEEAKNIADLFFQKNVPIYVARHKQYEQMCDTKSPQTILAVVHTAESNISPNSPLIVLDSVSDPGNLGTIIRTADWFGFKNIITGGYSVDKYNPKVIRSTMGSLFRCNVNYEADLYSFLKKKTSKYEIYGASLNGMKAIEECHPQKFFILVFGNEANGISKEIKTLLHYEYKIVGKGSAESLNLAVSVGISLFHFAKYT